MPDERVEHPRHYNMGRFEAIDVIEDWGLGFCLGNVVKYICRCDHTDQPILNLEKAAFYLAREIKRRKDEASVVVSEDAS